MTRFVAAATGALSAGLWAGLWACLWAGAALAEPAQDGDVWSRVTLAAPVFTRHLPHDQGFNDRNWGLFADVALTSRWSVLGGDFENSYRRNTAFLAASYSLFDIQAAHLKIDGGGAVGLDLNRGYRGHNDFDPLLAAAILKIRGAGFTNDLAFLNRLGLMTTIIPGAPKNGATAVNLAVTYRLP